MPTALIADDEPFMRAALRDHLATLWPELTILAEAEDGPSALIKIETLRPQIVFLDIRMPGMTGLEVARSMTVPSRAVFVTAYDAHAIEAFEASAVDYVLKPLEVARLARTVAKLRKSLETLQPATVEHLLEALKRLGVDAAAPSAAPASALPGSGLQWLQVAVGQQIRMVHLDEVMFFQADTKYTRVVSADCDGLIRLSLKELVDTASAGMFLQTHRSTVVNRRFIRGVHRKGEQVEIELKGLAERLKVSVSNHHLFKAM